MDLYHLKTFFTLAKVRNFTQAAKLLFVTQSAVSHAMKKLETSLDAQLIERSGKTLTLTRAGKALYRSCETIFSEIERAEQDIARFSRESKMQVRVGSTVEFGTSFLIKQLPPFLEKQPNIHLDFYFSPFLEEPLLRDEVDLAIDCEDHKDPDLEKIFLFREQFITIASPEFVNTNQIRSIDDLERVSILSNDKELNWWSNFIQAIPEEKRRCLKTVVQINHVRGIINAAILGLGIGFVPEYTVIRELAENTLIDPFPRIKPPADQFQIFIKKEKLKFEKNKAFIDYLTGLQPSEFGSD